MSNNYVSLALVRSAAGLLALWSLGGSVAEAAAGALDQPALAATPADLLAAAASVSAVDAPVVVLRDDTTVTFDDAGRAEHRYHLVIAILKPAAVDDWGTLELGWRPFYQQRPTIRARVIAPDGSVAEFDPTLIHDSPVVDESPNVFSDHRMMKAPLPRLAIGSVIEEEFVIADREPLLTAGISERVYVERYVPIHRARVTISAPTARKIQVVARGFAAAPIPVRTSRNGKTTWAYDLGGFAAASAFDSAVPADVVAAPYIGLSTAPSWSAVAIDYHRLVEERMKGPLALPAGLAEGTPRAIVDRTLAWLHANVRYTGIELRDSAIVPWTPAETMTRGFGDCKDKATLLIALLRAAGVHAELVLLADGPGADLDRELPGMGGFDHAIVRAKVAGKDLWIDATEDGLPAGQLPARDQGRAALVIAPGTRTLLTTPASVPVDNLIREVRTFHLAEAGYARLTEVTREHGVWRDDLRRWIRDTNRNDISKGLANYVKDEYRGQYVSFSTNRPTDVTQPYDFTVEVSDTARVHSAREQIDAYLFPSDTFARMPEIFTDTDPSIDGSIAKRRLDYAWTIPRVYEIENRLIVPPGFAAPQLVAHEQLALGTMTLTTTRRIERGDLVVTYRFDSGKPRITAAELAAGRAALLTLQNAPAEHVILPLTGATLMHQGKLAEAIAEFKRLIALHPKEALHRGQLAEAYRLAGMSVSARRTIREAVAIEPSSGDAYSLLGFHLRKDTVGREGGFDADRAGALAAYRKALALAPNHLGAMEDLASLLIVDDRGWVTSNLADQLEAIALWRRAKDQAKVDTFDRAIAEMLFKAGRYGEAEAAARALPEGDASAGLQVAAVAATRGSAQALVLARSLASGTRFTQVMTIARGWLMQVRRYLEMRALHAEIVGADPVFNAMVANLVQSDPERLDAADPLTPVILAMNVIVGMSADAGPWSHAVSEDLRRVNKELTVEQWNPLRILPRAVVGDNLAVAAKTAKIDGDASTGWRIEQQSGGNRAIYYVALERGRARLIGLSDVPTGVGHTMLSLLAKPDIPGAARWLKRVVNDVPHSAPSANLRGVATLSEKELVDGVAPTKPVIEVAAAMLVAVSDPKAAVPILSRCPVAHDETKAACRELLLVALADLGRWAEVDGVVQQMSVSTASDELRGRSLLSAGKTAEAIVVLDAALTKAPDNVELLLRRTLAAIASHGWPGAQLWVKKTAAQRAVDPTTLNNLAWASLYYDASPGPARALAQRAEAMTTPVAPYLANTLAAIEAESGQPFAAWQYLGHSISARSDLPPHDSDWYVLGRIAEAYGLRDDAIAAYRRVAPEPLAPVVRGPTAHEFAQRGLKRLASPSSALPTDRTR